MSDAMSFAQLEAHTVELLPARTVLSLVGTETINHPAPMGQDNNPTGGDHPMYDTWLYAWRQVLGLPHGSSAPAE